jgi:hypothetical protein
MDDPAPADEGAGASTDGVAASTTMAPGSAT